MREKTERKRREKEKREKVEKKEKRIFGFFRAAGIEIRFLRIEPLDRLEILTVGLRHTEVHSERWRSYYVFSKSVR